MLLSVTNVRKSYGPDVILEGASLRLESREKVALVGRNGAGKTTLLKILTGREAPDSGSVQFARGAKVGYLRQEMPVTAGRTVLEEAKQALQAQLDARDRLAVLEKTMEVGTPSPDDLEEYARLHEHFMDAEGYRAENDLKAVLIRMGFEEHEFDRPTERLSGGEKTRLALARLLLEEPDLLILDEPTNHLDIQATEWLESWLTRYHGAVLLVSHDRTFLENTAERVLEMRDGKIEAYPGPFDKYLRLKAERELRQAEVARRQEMEISRMDEYVRRFMNSQRTAQARGRLKLMNRLISEKVEAPKAEAGMKGGFAKTARSGDLALVTEKLTVGFSSGEDGDGPPVELISKLEWTVRNGERWGIVGENGAGKSTLVKTALGLLDPLSGRARIGSNVQLGLFTQDGADLDPDQSPLDHLVWEFDMKPAEARDLLARFLLTGEDVYRPIKTLSGGEKNKLSLAALTRLAPNLLVLDEPTNHLDMDSREALAKVLKGYEGTMLLVSHDRHLLSLVADHVLDVRKSGPIQYEGTFAEYRAKAAKPAPVAPTKAAPAPVAGVVPGRPAMSPRDLSKEIARLAKAVEGAERMVTRTEGEITSLETSLANLKAGDDVVGLSKAHHEAQRSLEERMSDWEELTTKLEEHRALQGG